jgi:hypothetical protein
MCQGDTCQWWGLCKQLGENAPDLTHYLELASERFSEMCSNIQEQALIARMNMG